MPNYFEKVKQSNSIDTLNINMKKTYSNNVIVSFPTIGRLFTPGKPTYSTNINSRSQNNTKVQNVALNTSISIKLLHILSYRVRVYTEEYPLSLYDLRMHYIICHFCP